MVDSLRHELTQVARRCEHIVLRRPEINKILNGKYLEVISNYEKTQVNLDEIAVHPAPISQETVLEDEDQEIKNELDDK